MLETTLGQMSGIRQPQRKFMIRLLTIFQVFRGSATLRNLSRYGAFSERAAARWYRRDFDFRAFNQALIARILPADTSLIAAFDATFIAKSGSKTAGLASFFDGAAGVSQKGLEFSTLAVVDVNYGTAYPLATTQTPAVLASGQTRVDIYRQQFQEGRPFLPPSVRYVATDGYYTKLKFTNGVVESGLDQIGKLRQDAALRYLYAGPQKPCGRHKVYDGSVDFDDLSRLAPLDLAIENLKAYTAVVNSVSLKRSIRILYLVKTLADKIQTATLFSTDTEIDPALIYRFYKARFQIEFVFRDAKQFTGFADAQSRQAKPLLFHANASMASLNLIKAQDRSHNQSQARSPISVANYKIQNYNENLIQHIFQTFNLDLTLIKAGPDYQKIVNYGCRIG